MPATQVGRQVRIKWPVYAGICRRDADEAVSRKRLTLDVSDDISDVARRTERFPVAGDVHQWRPIAHQIVGCSGDGPQCLDNSAFDEVMIVAGLGGRPVRS